MQRYSETCIFCVKQYIGFQKQLAGSALEVLAKYLKTVFDEIYFKLNLACQNSNKKYEDDIGHSPGYL